MINLTSSVDGEFTNIKDNKEYISVYKNGNLIRYTIYQFDNDSNKRILSNTMFNNSKIICVELYDAHGVIIHTQKVSKDLFHEFTSKDLEHKHLNLNRQTDLDYLLNAGMFSLCIYSLILFLNKIN